VALTFTEPELQKRLEDYAHLHANRLGYRFKQDAESHFSNLCAAAARGILERAETEGKPERTELYAREAEGAVSYYVEGMIAATYTLPGYREENPNQIGELTFWSVHASFCPCWPFC